MSRSTGWNSALVHNMHTPGAFVPNASLVGGGGGSPSFCAQRGRRRLEQWPDCQDTWRRWLGQRRNRAVKHWARHWGLVGEAEPWGSCYQQLCHHDPQSQCLEKAQLRGKINLGWSHFLCISAEARKCYYLCSVCPAISKYRKGGGIYQSSWIIHFLATHKDIAGSQNHILLQERLKQVSNPTDHRIKP